MATSPLPFAADLHRRRASWPQVALVGRSMLNVFNAANNLGYIQKKPDTLIEISQVDNHPPEQVVIISTGSQGEPMSALTRIAFSNPAKSRFSRAIPSSPRPRFRATRSRFTRSSTSFTAAGAKVYYSALADVHVPATPGGRSSWCTRSSARSSSSRRTAKPACSISTRSWRLSWACRLKTSSFWPTAISLRFPKGSARVTGFTNGDAVLIDGASVGEVDNSVLRERKLLSDDGVVAISLAVNRKTGAMMAQPVVSAMGFPLRQRACQIEGGHLPPARAANAVARIAASGKEGAGGGFLRPASGSAPLLHSRRTKRRPVVMINLIEVDS